MNEQRVREILQNQEPTRSRNRPVHVNFLSPHRVHARWDVNNFELTRMEVGVKSQLISREKNCIYGTL